MKKVIIIMLAAAMGVSAGAATTSSTTSSDQTAKTTQTSDKVFNSVEQMPSYPGGNTALAQFISTYLIYPEEALEAGASGRVIVEFVVNEDGSISDVKVVRGKHPALDAEAVRIVKKMPKWNPGKQGGHTVKVRYTMPISFSLQTE